MTKYPLFDGHCDTGYEIYIAGGHLKSNKLHVDLDRQSKYGPCCQIFAIYAPDNFENTYSGILEKVTGEITENSETLELCRTAEDIKRVTESGKVAALLSIEGAELLGCDEKKLELAKKSGISSVNITWNYENDLSGSNAQGEKKGLTEKGKSFVKKCRDLHVAVDVSHISDPGFWDIVELNAGPFYASHSNSRKICGHKRNLTDEQFKAIVDAGGVAGLNMYTEFLGEKAGISTIIKHIDHFLSLGGAKHISIGADFDGCDSLPEGICGVQDMRKLYDELIRLGYGQELADDIFFNNLFRFFSSVL